MLEHGIKNLENQVAQLTFAVEKLTEVLNGNNPPNLPTNTAKQPEREQVFEDTNEYQKNDTSKEIDIEHVREALIGLSKTRGKQAAKDVLAYYNAAKVGDLKKADYAGVVEKATQQQEAV